jgi:hypothetical protein
MIKDFIVCHPSGNFRNKTELISELNKCVEEGVYAN